MNARTLPAAGRARYGDAAADAWLDAIVDRALTEHARWQALSSTLAGPDVPVVRVPVTVPHGRVGPVTVDRDCPAWRAVARAAAGTPPQTVRRYGGDAALLRSRVDARVGLHAWRAAVTVDASDRLRMTSVLPVPGVHAWITLAGDVHPAHAAAVLETYAGIDGSFDDDYAQLTAALLLTR